MSAFATIDQLSVRLGRSFDSSEAPQVLALLDDATAYLRREIGAQVTTGVSTITLNVPMYATSARLPQWPVRSLDSVTINGTADTSTLLRDGSINRLYGFPLAPSADWSIVTVTYTHGLAAVPADLVSWTCVIAANVLAQVGRSGTLSTSGVKSEAIEDYSIVYKDGADTLSLPEPVLARLRAAYGRGAFVVGSRR
jgi:hypothetical protein